MAVEATTPDDYLGDVIGDINSEEERLKQWNSKVQTSRLKLQYL